MGQVSGQAARLFCVFKDQDGVEVHKQAKKERGQHQTVLTEQAWSIIKGFITLQSGKFFLRDTAGNPERPA